MDGMNRRLMLDSAISNVQFQYNKLVKMHKKVWDYYWIDNNGMICVLAGYDEFNKKLKEQELIFKESYKRMLSLKEEFEIISEE